jgi:hypothetical protein
MSNHPADYIALRDYKQCEGRRAVSAAALHGLRQIYKRNRDKDHSEHRELAQALFMLYTAYGPRPFYGEWWPDDNIDIDDVCFATVMALKYGGEEIKTAIRTICQYVGDGIAGELAQALDALRAKHGVTTVTEVA